MLGNSDAFSWDSCVAPTPASSRRCDGLVILASAHELTSYWQLCALRLAKLALMRSERR